MNVCPAEGGEAGIRGYGRMRCGCIVGEIAAGEIAMGEIAVGEIENLRWYILGECVKIEIGPGRQRGENPKKGQRIRRCAGGIL